MTTPSDQTITKETETCVYEYGDGHACARSLDDHCWNVRDFLHHRAPDCRDIHDHAFNPPAGVAQESQPAQCEPVFRGDALVWCKTHSRDFGECRRAIEAQPAQRDDWPTEEDAKAYGAAEANMLFNEREPFARGWGARRRYDKARIADLQSRLTAATDALVRATPILSGLDFNLADAITDLAGLNTTLDARLTAALKERDALRAEMDSARSRAAEYWRIRDDERIALATSLTAAEERERKLVEALRVFGLHLIGCSFYLDESRCSCGLAALLAERSQG